MESVVTGSLCCRVTLLDPSEGIFRSCVFHTVVRFLKVILVGVLPFVRGTVEVGGDDLPSPTFPGDVESVEHSSGLRLHLCPP